MKMCILVEMLYTMIVQVGILRFPFYGCCPVQVWIPSFPGNDPAGRDALGGRSSLYTLVDV